MTDPQAVAAPRTSAGRALVEDEPRLVTGEHSMLVRVLAIEAEARQQMKSETREQIFRDNGLIADPLAAASPAAPAVDRAWLNALWDEWILFNEDATRKGSGFTRDQMTGAAGFHRFAYARLQDTVDPVASTGGEQ